MNYNFYDFIFNEEFWLPNNFTWSEINKYNNFSFNHSILYPIYTAFIIYLLRCSFERLIALPIGRYLNVKETNCVNFKPNSILEVYYTDGKTRDLSESIYMHLSRETEINIEGIKEWFESRSSLNKPSKMKKFTESFWRFAFYLLIFFYGVFVLYKKPWFWDTKECWIDYPKHKISDDIFWYYTIELGFYLSLLVSQFFDVKRKDFWQMFLHHVVTISLLMFSSLCNFTRLGSLVLLVHDCADSWLELSKMTSYSNLKKICNFSFVTFATVWFVTRLVAFPSKILYTTTFEAPLIVGGLFPAYYLFNMLLYTLQIMHVIWFYMICKIAYKSVLNGSVDRDDRSESDLSEINNQRDLKNE